MDICFHFSESKFMFKIFRKCQAMFHSSWTILHPNKQGMRIHFSPSLPTLYYVCFLLQSSSNCAVLSHYGFKMHFPNDGWGWISFHMLIDHSYIFFGKMSIQDFCSFFYLDYFSFYFWIIIVLSIFWMQVHYLIYDL